MDNLEEMDRFLEKFNLPRLNQEEIEIMSNPITSTEIEAVVKNLLKNKSLGPRANAYHSKTLSKNCRGKNTSKLILRGHHHPDIKTKEKTQINKIRNEKEEVTTDNAEIQRIIRDYHEQLSGI